MYILHTFSDRFAIDIENSNVAILIDRQTNLITKTTTAVGNTVDTAFSQRIYGLVGVVTLLRGRYLIAITDSVTVASIQGNAVQKLTDATIIAYNPDAPLTAQQQQDEEQYLALLRRVLLSGAFYFSYSYDLTLSTQDIALLSTAEGQQQLQRSAGITTDGSTTDDDLSLYSPGHWRRADSRFFWNQYLSAELIESHADEWVVPLLNGYVSSTILDIQQHTVEYLLVSRRAWERTGRRFVTRGLDRYGKAANYAEAEQIVYAHNKVTRAITASAFTQTRGSIPLLWQQPVTLKYAPKIEVLKQGSSETAAAFRLHFAREVQKYGKNVCLNLINQKGAELQLVKEFTRVVQAEALSEEVRLVNWDFHQECKKMKYENIDKLVKLVDSDVQDAGYFTATIAVNPQYSNGNNNNNNNSRQQLWLPTQYVYTITQQQKGVIRSNCMDCLDRTNVVQSVFAGKALDDQLLRMGIVTAPTAAAAATSSSSKSHSVRPPALVNLFRNVWANNADAMSFQYSGTGALKTDYTRTGKRSLRGAINDGVNSVTRYYLNNFADGVNQDSVDLFLGLYRPHRQQLSPFDNSIAVNKATEQHSLFAFLLRYVVSVFALLTAVTHLTPITSTLSSLFIPAWYHSLRSTSPTATTVVECVLLLSVIAFGGVKLSVKYGKRFVNRPKLRRHLMGEEAAYAKLAQNEKP